MHPTLQKDHSRGGALPVHLLTRQKRAIIILAKPKYSSKPARALAELADKDGRLQLALERIEAQSVSDAYKVQVRAHVSALADGKSEPGSLHGASVESLATELAEQKKEIIALQLTLREQAQPLVKALAADAVEAVAKLREEFERAEVGLSEQCEVPVEPSGALRAIATCEHKLREITDVTWLPQINRVLNEYVAMHLPGIQRG